MKKIIFFICLTFVNLFADAKYGLDMTGGFAQMNSSLSTNGIKNKIDFGKVNGYNFSSSFIVNDGYLFGNSGYVTVNYNKLNGTLNDSSADYKKIEYGILLSENYLTNYDNFLVGVGFKHLDIDLDTLSYTGNYIGINTKYEHYFYKTYGAGLSFGAYSPFVFNNYLSITDNGNKYTPYSSYYLFFDVPLSYKIDSSFFLQLHNKYEYTHFSKTQPFNGKSFKSSTFKSSTFKSFSSILSLRIIFN